MTETIISFIVAMDRNKAIGHNNDLMWHLPDDFKWFKEKTRGKPMIMGRNTMLSLKKPLPGRLNIVISSRNSDILDGFVYAESIEKALTLVPEGTEEIMIIGGGQVYRHSLGMADRMYITIVNHAWPEADTFFPEWNAAEWKEIYREHHPSDERHLYSFDFLILDRV